MDSNMTLKLNVVCVLARYCKEHASFNPKAQIPLGVLLKLRMSWMTPSPAATTQYYG